MSDIEAPQEALFGTFEIDQPVSPARRAELAKMASDVVVNYGSHEESQLASPALNEAPQED